MPSHGKEPQTEAAPALTRILSESVPNLSHTLQNVLGNQRKPLLSHYLPVQQQEELSSSTFRVAPMQPNNRQQQQEPTPVNCDLLQNSSWATSVKNGRPASPVINESRKPHHPQSVKHYSSLSSLVPAEGASLCLPNPLCNLYNYKLLCKHCFVFTGNPGQYIYSPINHRCEENILALHQKSGAGGSWLRVRERTNHRNFPGNYIMCRSVVFSQKVLCKFKEEFCSYAHNHLEQQLWTMEKDGFFDITEFIMQNRSSNISGFMLKELFQKHYPCFWFLCWSCFMGSPKKVCVRSSAGRCCSGVQAHPWAENEALVHENEHGRITLINKRMLLQKNAFFKICYFQEFFSKEHLSVCRLAHSMVERDVWMVERDTGVTRAQIVEKSASFWDSGGESMKQQGGSAAGTSRLGELSCPHRVLKICIWCWKTGKVSEEEPNKDRCKVGHTNWLKNHMYLLVPANKEIRPLPKKIPHRLNFSICKYILERKSCDYSGGGPCQFAHSQEEISVWCWMASNNVRTLEELANYTKKPAALESTPVQKITSGQSVVTVNKPVTLLTNVHLNATSPHYCQYCSVQCNSLKKWDQHIASQNHMFNVNSDKEHQWNFRQPAWGLMGLDGGTFALCLNHEDGRKCPYSTVPDMYNLCPYAHSQGELDEWKERCAWRKMKQDIAKNLQVFSYTDQLIEEFKKSSKSIEVMTEKLDGVTVENCEETIYMQEKNASYTWTYRILSKKNQLNKVALLYNKDRLRFALLCPDNSKHCQVALGDSFVCNSDSGQLCYNIDIQFTGSMFGSFSQLVVFDFGLRPVLFRKLTVEVGTSDKHEKMQQLREQLKFDRWTSENRIIKPFHNNKASNAIMKCYKTPSSADSIITHHSIFTELNRHNYVHKMHKLIEMEELKRHQIISSYNLCTMIEILDRIQEDGLVFPSGSELFARVPLVDYLTEDTDAGKLILTSVKSVLLAPVQQPGQVVYEAQFVGEDNFNYDGRSCNHIYLCLSPLCCTSLHLKSGDRVEMEIQFQMDRRLFCYMHYGIDQLQNINVVFPDVNMFNPVQDEEPISVRSSILNKDQMTAVEHIVAKRSGYTPPFIIYGPFGTGKTETLAQATMVLLKERPDARILICTQSNSAADLYITKHLHNFLKKKNDLLRIYFSGRRMNTVSEEVKKYCLISKDEQNFISPTKSDLMNYRLIIITLACSMEMLGEMRGQFTHILIDEAAQDLECVTVFPLSLATENTCIVLAGDHRQMSPKVYSPEAREQKFHISLLERMFNYYEMHVNSKLISTRCPSILLRRNYRNVMEITRFISATFYGGPEMLISNSIFSAVPELVPLSFYVVQGRESQDEKSVSFYNQAEVMEIVQQVKKLMKNWPQQWGPRSAQEIGVVSAYYNQVLRIRHVLRAAAKNFKELRDVTVERMNNVQGKEFRALFISTVRTSNLINAPHLQNLRVEECDGEVGDFGFLSDPKLLNTALTRAQSLVVVVGDPVALCGIGDCCNLWRTYVKHCQNLKSIFPQTHTVEKIRQEVLSLISSDAGKRLQEIMNLSREPVHQFQLRQQASERARQEERTSARGIASPDFKEVETAVKHDAGPLFKLEEFVFVQPGEILQQFAEESQTDMLADDQPTSGQVLEKNIRITLSGNCAVIDYPISEEKHNNLAFDDEYSGSSIMDLSVDSMEEMYSPHLSGYISEKCKLGRLCIDAPDRIYVHIDGDSNQKVPIYSRQNCGRGSDGDMVYVKICESKPLASIPEPIAADAGRAAVGLEPLHGKVIKVATSPVHNSCLVVCKVFPSNTGMMVPLNESMHPLFNLTPKNLLQQVKKGFVCVYFIGSNKKVTFDHFEKVDAAIPSEKLFLVQNLGWHSSCDFPIGIVVGVLEVSNALDSQRTLLDATYEAKKKFNNEAEEEARCISQQVAYISPSVYLNREDCREKETFVISGNTGAEQNMALSIEDTSIEGVYVLGVHIADVSLFIKPGSVLDREAASRLSVQHPFLDEPIHLLPKILCVDTFSLTAGSNKPTISVFMTVEDGVVIGVEVKKSVVFNKIQISCETIEAIVTKEPDGSVGELNNHIKVLYWTAKAWRKKRLGNAHLENIDMGKKSPKANLIVNEIAIMTNHQVAILLMKRFPNKSLICVQNEPDAVALEKWRMNHVTNALNTVALTKPFLLNTSVCSCQSICACLVAFVKKYKVKVSQTVDIITDVWKMITEASDKGSMQEVQDLIVSAVGLPSLVITKHELSRLIPNEQLQCSVAVDKNACQHYSMNLEPYTFFTNPLNSYVDLLIQRFTLALLDSQPTPLSQDEILNAAYSLSLTSRKVERYKQRAGQLSVAMATKLKPDTFYGVVKSVGETALGILLCANPDLAPLEISFVLLGLSKIPAASLDCQVVLTWHKRIYSLSPSQPTVEAEELVLNPDQHVCRILSIHWQRLLGSLRAEDMSRLKNNVASAQNSGKSIQENAGYAWMVRSGQRQDGGGLKHFVDFSLKLGLTNVIKGQLGAKMIDGFLTPMIQLINVVPTFSICLEHRRDPVGCFMEESAACTVKLNYNNVESYQKVWMSVLNMEAVHSGVTMHNSVYIQDVSIVWLKDQDSGGNQTYSGQFQISFKNYQEWKINFSVSDFLCVRYPFVKLCPTGSDCDKSVTWVGHCLVVEVLESQKAGIIRVIARLVQTSCGKPSNSACCTIEHISRPPLIRSMEHAVSELSNSTQLAKEIALGRGLANVGKMIAYQITNQSCPHLQPPSQDQVVAIEAASRKTFTVINGGAGTGKTVTAVHLVHMFVQHNRKVQQRGQVLVCAPSDESLDIIETHLKLLHSSGIQILRVYDRCNELLDFPIPFESQLTGLSSSPEISKSKELALHHRIRMPGNSFHAQILEFDIIFELYEDSIIHEQVEEYFELLSKAEEEEFQKADIILCPCLVSDEDRFKLFTDVRQIVIDDANMCLEPETMVPIISHSAAERVVLLGDHRQLQPQVLHPATTPNNSLRQSLLEQYAEKAISLKTQFRMNSLLSSFINNYLYGNRMTTQNNLPEEFSLLAFCHMVGEEQHTLVQTSRCLQPSVSNELEAAYAVNYALGLVQHHKINRSKIMLLAFHDAQVSLLRKKLREKRLMEIKVMSVRESAGFESEIVILSTVRSLPRSHVEKYPTAGWMQEHLGSVSDDHLITVALTRSSRGLFILGNKYLLQAHSFWRSLLKSYHARDKLLLAEEHFLQC